MAYSGPSGFLPPTGLAGFLAKPGLRELLMSTGAALLQQKDQPGSLGGALGRALPVGMQAFQQAQQQAQADALIASAPPEMQQLLRALPAGQRGAALLSLLTPKDRAPVVVGKSLVDPDNPEKPLYTEPTEPEKGPEMPADLRTALWLADIDPATATPEQKAKVEAKLKELKGPSLAEIVGGVAGIGKLPTTAQSAVVSLQTITGALDDFEGYAKDWAALPRGDKVAGKVGVPDEVRDSLLANLKASQSAVLLELKGLAQLGALSGSDVDLVTDMIGNPTSWEAIRRDPQAVLQSIQRARSYIDRAKDTYQRTYGVSVPGAEPTPAPAGNSDPLGIRR